MKEDRVGFLAGLAGGFGFYIARMILAMEWQTTTTGDAAMKRVIGFVLATPWGCLNGRSWVFRSKVDPQVWRGQFKRHNLLAFCTAGL